MKLNMQHTPNWICIQNNNLALFQLSSGQTDRSNWSIQSQHQQGPTEKPLKTCKVLQNLPDLFSCFTYCNTFLDIVKQLDSGRNKNNQYFVVATFASENTHTYIHSSTIQRITYAWLCIFRSQAGARGAIATCQPAQPPSLLIDWLLLKKYQATIGCSGQVISQTVDRKVKSSSHIKKKRTFFSFHSALRLRLRRSVCHNLRGRRKVIQFEQRCMHTATRRVWRHAPRENSEL